MTKGNYAPRRGAGAGNENEEEDATPLLQKSRSLAYASRFIDGGLSTELKTAPRVDDEEEEWEELKQLLGQTTSTSNQADKGESPQPMQFTTATCRHACACSRRLTARPLCMHAGTPNPEEDISWIQRLTFTYVSNLINLGRKKHLEVRAWLPWGP